MAFQWLSKGRWPGLVVGVAVTAAACLLHSRQLTDSDTWLSDPIEMPVLDLHLRQFRYIQASTKLLHVDIDDGSIKRWGRWPWSRDTLAGLIGVLDECGARTIALDIILPEPEDDQYRAPTRNRYAGLTGDVETLGVPSDADWVEADKMLAATIRDAGSVFIGVDYELRGRKARMTLKERFKAALRKEMAPLLRADLALGEQEIWQKLKLRGVEERLGTSITFDKVQRVFPRAKRDIAIELVHELCTANPGITYADVHERLLSTPVQLENADKQDVVAGFARFRSMRAALAHFPPVPPGLRGKLRPIARFNPPWYEFGFVAHGLGSAVFNHDQVGGVIREQRLMVELDGRLIKQMGFAVVCDYLGIRDEELSIDASGNLVIEGSDDRPKLRVPLSDDGALLVNWHHASAWDESFEHVPATRFLEVFSLGRSVVENDRKIEILRGEVAQAFLGAEEIQRYREHEREIVDLRLQLRRHDYAGGDAADGAALRARLDAALAARTLIDRELAEFVQANHEAIAGEQPQDDGERKDFEKIRAAHAKLTNRVATLDATNAALAEDIERTKQKLVEETRGKICVIGYAATALADYMVTPLFSSVPGAMMHSNIANNFLQNDFVRKTRAEEHWQVTGLIAVAGLATVVVALSVGPVPSLTFVLALMLTYSWVHASVIWGRGDVYLASAMPLATIFVNWAFVTLYRQLTEERSKCRWRSERGPLSR